MNILAIEIFVYKSDLKVINHFEDCQIEKKDISINFWTDNMQTFTSSMQSVVHNVIHKVQKACF